MESAALLRAVILTTTAPFKTFQNQDMLQLELYVRVAARWNFQIGFISFMTHRASHAFDHDVQI